MKKWRVTADINRDTIVEAKDYESVAEAFWKF